jgi:uncharacterized protein
MMERTVSHVPGHQQTLPAGTEDKQEEGSMEEFVKWVLIPLIDFPDQLRVDSVEKNGTLLISVSVAVPDVGRVVGKKGRTAMALRTLLSAACAKKGMRVRVTIEEKPAI